MNLECGRWHSVFIIEWTHYQFILKVNKNTKIYILIINLQNCLNNFDLKLFQVDCSNITRGLQII